MTSYSHATFSFTAMVSLLFIQFRPLDSALDCSQSPFFSVGFSRLVGIDGAAVVLRERDLGRVSKLPRGTGLGRRRENFPPSPPLN